MMGAMEGAEEERVGFLWPLWGKEEAQGLNKAAQMERLDWILETSEGGLNWMCWKTRGRDRQ